MNKSQRAVLSLSWQSIAYGIGILGSQLIVYILLPFLTRYMTREDIGVISLITALYALLNVMTNAGLPVATFRFFNKSENEEDQRATIGASQFLFFLFALIPAIGILFFSRLTSMLLLGSEQYAVVLQVVSGFLIVDSMNSFGAIILRLEMRSLISSIHSIILIGCQAGFALLFVITAHMGVLGYWLGQLIGEMLGLVFMVWLIRKKIVLQVSMKRVSQLAKFGIPLMPAALAMTALRLGDRYIIGALLGLEQVAIYDIGYKIGSIISLVTSAFRVAWAPFAFSIATKPEAPRIYSDVLTYLTAICSFLTLAVVAFSSQLVQIVAPESYAGAVIVVGWVAASQLFLAVYLVFSMGPMLADRTHQIVWITLLAAGVNLLLNFVLIRPMGIVGAALATFVGYALLAILSYFLGKRSLNLNIDWKRMFKLALVSGLVALIILTADQFIILGLWVEILAKVLGLISFPILLLLVKFMNPGQVRDLFETGKNWVGKRIMTNERNERNFDL